MSNDNPMGQEEIIGIQDARNANACRVTDNETTVFRIHEIPAGNSTRSTVP